MECRHLEITLRSAKDLKDVNLFTKMDVYAVVSISGDHHHNKQKQRTPVDKDCGSNPKWNYPMRFTIDEDAAQKNRLSLKFELKSERNLGDREIGEVYVPIKELLEKNVDGGKEKVEHNVSYSVRMPNGKTKGAVEFSFKFGDKFNAPAAEVHKTKKMDEPVMAFPPPSSSSSYPAPGGYPAPVGYPPAPAAGKDSYPYPPPGGYPPPPPAYGGYPSAPAPGYGYPGYPAQQPGYGYGYGYQPPMQNAQKPKKSGGGKMALGLGAGLLGGLLVGDMISDASYDAGFADGLDF